MSYELLRALHFISFISWMAGLLYLPRLFVYHANVAAGSEASELFKQMERKLLRYIMNPAMIATWIFGLWLMFLTGYGGPGTGGWMHAKLVLVLALSGSHGMMASYRRKFANDANTKSAKFYRWFNEVPTVLMIGIVLLATTKPF